MLGLNSYTPNFQSRPKFLGGVIDTYDNVMEKKDNYIAVRIANNTNSDKRAGAAAIGAGSGVLTALLTFGVYALLKKHPKLNNKLFDKFIVKKFDKWMNRGTQIFNTQKGIKKIFSGLAVKTAYAAGIGAVTGYLFGLYHTIKNTNVNGRISHTRPGAQGEWIARGLNTLSKTTEGQNIIKNSITKNPDNTYTVKLSGINKEYKVTKKELEEASKTYLTESDENGKTKGFKRKFSKGDGDILLFEIAVDKYCKEIQAGTMQRNPNVPLRMHIVSEDGDIVAAGGSESGLFYLLTGKTLPPQRKNIHKH